MSAAPAKPSSGIGNYVWATLLVAIVTHLVIINAIPGLLMDVAINRLSDHGARLNMLSHAPRVTPESRQVVRPSPDLHYSSCPYDLSHGPVQIAVAPWQDYWSLSLFASNSDNFFVLDDREAHDGAVVTIVRAGRPHPEHAGQVIESPSERGIALIRRLAPDAGAFANADAVAQADSCAPFHP